MRSTLGYLEDYIGLKYYNNSTHDHRKIFHLTCLTITKCFITVVQYILANRN